MKYCVLNSGSNGNACYVEAGAVRLLIDMGMGPRTLGRRLEAMMGRGLDEITHLLLTHEHSDHIRGITGLLKLNPELPVFASFGTLLHLPRKARTNGRAVEADSAFSLGPVSVHPFATSHDGAEPLGFRLEAEGAVLGFATDLGELTPCVREALSGCTGLVLESNHCPEMLRKGPYPPFLKARVAGRLGHLSNVECRQAMSRLIHPGLRSATLAHLSKVNNSEAAVRATFRELFGGPMPGWIVLGSRTCALNPVDLSSVDLRPMDPRPTDPRSVDPRLADTRPVDPISVYPRKVNQRSTKPVPVDGKPIQMELFRAGGCPETNSKPVVEER